MDYRVIRENMAKMDGVLDRPLSDADFIASHLQRNHESTDDPLLWNEQKAPSWTYRYHVSSLKSEDQLLQMKEHQAQRLNTAVFCTYETSYQQNAKSHLLQPQPSLPADFKTYYQRGKKGPHGRAKRVSPGVP
ncbi:hypothetical protein ACMFMG_006306 [Clarireedia jacksonii]